MNKYLRKFFCICMASLMVLSATVTSSARSSDFSDVSPNAWFADAVDYVAEKGLFSGPGDGKFHPKDSMNRAMLVTVLANGTENYREEDFSVGGFLGPSLEVLPYTDVDESNWYGLPIRWATRSEIANGRENHRFQPLGAVTREEAAVMLYRYAANTGNDVSHTGTAADKFSDSNAVSRWAVDAVDWAVEHRVLRGYSNGALRPGKTITRAEAASILF